MKVPGEIVSVEVANHRRFGAFVWVIGSTDPQVALLHWDVIYDGPRPESMPRLPPVGMKMKAIVIKITEAGQCQVGVNKLAFTHFGLESEWLDWTKDLPDAHA